MNSVEPRDSEESRPFDGSEFKAVTVTFAKAQTLFLETRLSNVDPTSLASLEGTALSEGVKFLYGQASEVLKRRRERQEGKEDAARQPVPVEGSERVLAGSLQAPSISFEKLDEVAEALNDLRLVLGSDAAHSASGAASKELTEAADAVRSALELVYGQRITFKGEHRPPSGPVVIGDAEAASVTGELAGVRARIARAGHIEGTAETGEASGTVAGVDIDSIG